MKLKNISEIKKKIKIYVNKVDPWALIEMGAPEDEYDSHIDRIVSIVVNKKPNKESLELELFSIFKTKEFELEKDKIKELAENIYQIKIQKNRSEDAS